MSIQNKLINFVKYNKFIFSLYGKIGELGLRLIRPFIKQDMHLILITCFGGRKYDDSPRAIYEEMIKDSRFDQYRIVWAFRDPASINLPGRGEKIKIDSFLYYKLMYKARVWITNSGMERGLFFDAKNIYHIQTWHGTAIKKLGLDSTSEAFGQTKETPVNLWLAQSQYDVDVYSRCYNLPIEIFQITGLPRNDELTKCDGKRIDDIKHKLCIPVDKKVILYAPTFREFTRDSSNNCIIAPPLNLSKWKEQLGNEYVLLFRAHYEVVKSLNIKEDEFCIDVSNYPNLNELMMVSDILLSDYSSIFIDYSILERPMLLFTYDYDEYTEKRGVYFDIREALDDYAATEDQVIENLKSLDVIKRKKIARKFKNKYVTASGTASQQVLNAILENV